MALGPFAGITVYKNFRIRIMGEVLEFPTPNSSNGAQTRILGRRAENFRWEWYETASADLRTVNVDTAPSEYIAPPIDCA